MYDAVCISGIRNFVGTLSFPSEVKFQLGGHFMNINYLILEKITFKTYSTIFYMTA